MAEEDGKKEDSKESALKMDAEALKAEMERRKIAAEEAKREAERKKAERQQVINERVGEPRALEGIDDDGLKQILQQYYDRVYSCESDKYDLERKVMVNDFEINELTKQVMDLRGKFIKPKLRKVSMEFEDLTSSKDKGMNKDQIQEAPTQEAPAQEAQWISVGW